MKTILYGCCVMLLVACHQTVGVGALLDRAAEVVDKEPALARQMLDTLALNAVEEPAERARFALLYARTLDKCYIDVADDSLTRVAVAYYKRHGVPCDRAHALYYHARVKMNAGLADEAVSLLVEALTYAIESKEVRLQALIHSSLGNLYGQQYANRKALEHYREAEACFAQLGEELNRAFLLENIGHMHYLLEEYEQALPVLEQALDKFVYLKVYAKAQHTAAFMVPMMLQKGKSVADIKGWLRKHYQLNGSSQIPMNDYGVWMDLYMRDKQLDSARMIGIQALNHKSSFSKKHLAGFYAQLSVVEKKSEDFKKAYSYQATYQAIIDTLAMLDHHKAIYEIETKYKNKLLQERYETERMRRRLQWVIFGVALVGGTCVIAYWIRCQRRLHRRAELLLRRSRAELGRMQEQYSTMYADYQVVRAELSRADAQEQRLGEALEMRLKGLKQLIEKTKGTKEATFKQAFHRFAQVDTYSKTALSDLQYVVNKKYYGIIDHLKAHYEELGKHDLDLCALLCFGFSQYAICYLYGYGDLATYYNKRSRLRHRLHLPPDCKLEDFIQEELRKLRRAQWA